MKKLALIAAIACMAAPILAQPPAPSQMINTGHDLSIGSTGTTFNSTNVPNICVFCHTPHQAVSAAGQDPLWNHTLSAVASYGVYGSATLNAVPTDLGGAVIGTAAVSNLCLSCHDGTVGVGSLYNDPNSGAPDNAGTMITGNSNLGTDLTDDHPVNFTYDTALATADGELYDPATTPETAALLFAGQVQCASCHDPHDPTFTPFLVADNTDSALCVHCHVK